MIKKGFHSQSLHLTRISIQLEELKKICESKVDAVSGILNFSCPVQKYDLQLPLKKNGRLYSI
jgi:hypothetical protein